VREWQNTLVAKRVETRAQLEWLTNCGCELIQGFYYSLPLPEDAFIDYFDRFQDPDNPAEH
jgi:EAL domain-containing protein (putative c-di-GMP-specific phosphodiesterase class I)